MWDRKNCQNTALAGDKQYAPWKPALASGSFRVFTISGFGAKKQLE